MPTRLEFLITHLRTAAEALQDPLFQHSRGSGSETLAACNCYAQRPVIKPSHSPPVCFSHTPTPASPCFSSTTAFCTRNYKKVETGQKCPACALLAGTRENGRWEPVSREKLENVCLCVWSAGAIVMYIKGRDKKCAENMDHLSPLRFASAVDIFGSEMRHKGALNVKRKRLPKQEENRGQTPATL